ncbi:MAG TPA: hypothetical protein VMM84_17505 [Pyrinomonadaceae bacterium]|nr:hypothetical protein [Pyrinomonadaceae bacterium]
MMGNKRLLICAFIGWLCVFPLTPPAAHANSRTIEFPFKLSADLRSEFSVGSRVGSPGVMLIEATWAPIGIQNAIGSSGTALSLVILRPDGVEVVRRRGVSPLRLDYRITEDEIDRLGVMRTPEWTIKLINDVDRARTEVEGKLRITIPNSVRSLVDQQFTLLDARNAQEMAFSVTMPGRLVIEAIWQKDKLSTEPAGQSPLALLLIHPAQDRTYARRQGGSPLRVEQQVTEREIDKGMRWIARIENLGQAKVRGLLSVSFFPSP